MVSGVLRPSLALPAQRLPGPFFVLRSAWHTLQKEQKAGKRPVSWTRVATATKTKKLTFPPNKNIFFVDQKQGGRGKTFRQEE